MAQLFANLGTPLSYEKVADIFMKYDKDESGQIDFPEFLSMFQVCAYVCMCASYVCVVFGWVGLHWGLQGA